jgi:F0F1-type ATP synthase delta subunit
VLVPIIVAHVFVLVAVIVVIKRLLLGDSMNAVNRLKQVEVEVRRKEETIRREIEEHEKEFAKKKVEAEEELQRQREAQEKELGRMRDQIATDARKEGERIIEQAKKNEEKMRKQLAQEMEEKAVEYSGQMFQLVFSERMSAEINKHFVGELLDALEEVDAASITVDSSQADFVCSHPLDPEQKGRLEKLLKEKFGADIKVQEKVREDLMAGIIFKLGSLEIDGSLANRCREAVAEVKKSAKT